MQKPDVYPEFASVDTANGPSGQNNVVEPTPTKKQQGFDWGEIPPREIWNWVQRYNYLWIKYREERSNEVDSFFTSQW